MSVCLIWWMWVCADLSIFFFFFFLRWRWWMWVCAGIVVAVIVGGYCCGSGNCAIVVFVDNDDDRE